MAGAILTPALSMANETINDPRLEEGVWTTGPDGELIPDYESTFPTINEGEVVHGTVVRVDKDEVLVDIGYKSEGVIPVSELSIRRAVNPADEVSVGDEIDALVMTKEDADGRLILSKKRARFELAWKAIETAAESGDPVNGRVIEVVKGGLILDLGVRGFLPASLVDIRPVQDLDESVVEGRVTKVVTFGAFVEILPGVEGLVHISELAQHHVENPREVVSQGDPVNVLILEVDAERRRLSLSLKRVEEGMQVQPRADGGESIHTAPRLDLSEEVFSDRPAPVAEAEAGEVETADEPAPEADA